MQRFRSLTTADFRILLAVEAGMANYEYVPLDTILEYANIPKAEALHRIDLTYTMRLIRRSAGAYVGYTLTYAGYDYLALNALVKGGVIEAIGGLLGIGKEADIYEAVTPKGERIALKFHRLGRTSFRQTRRLRNYAVRGTMWLFQSREAAEKEYAALQRAYNSGVSVPRPLAQNRHAVAMGIIEGVELAECLGLQEPKAFLLDILSNLKRGYREAKIVHGDLSGFNVIVKPDGNLLIIDWPQYVTTEHPEAERLLQRDIRNILNFFRQKFRVTAPFDAALSYVKGESDTLNSNPRDYLSGVGV